MRIRILAAAAAFGVAAMPVLAGEPAVSVLNFKVTAQAGDVEDEGAWLGLAQVTAPLGHAWGLQGEAGVFDFDGDTAWGLAGHAFTRDPAQYLVGAFGAYASSDAFDIDVGRIGLEGEYYLERITLAANTGYQFGDSFIDDTWFGEVAATWYSDDDFGITGGAAFDDEIVILVNLPFDDVAPEDCLLRHVHPPFARGMPQHAERFGAARTICAKPRGRRECKAVTRKTEHRLRRCQVELATLSLERLPAARRKQFAVRVFGAVPGRQT